MPGKRHRLDQGTRPHSTVSRLYRRVRRDWERAETKRREKSVCIRCREHDALEYPAGHGGQLCDECEDLQQREHEKWTAEQCPNDTLGRAINQRRGF